MNMETLRADMVAAMKAREKEKKEAISSLVSAVKKAAIDEGCRDDIPEELVDRAIRLISELGKLPYEEACYALFDAVEAMVQEDWSNREKPSPVQYTLARIGRK